MNVPHASAHTSKISVSHIYCIRVILLFSTIGANLLQMAKNKSHFFAKLVKECGAKDSQPKSQKRYILVVFKKTRLQYSIITKIMFYNLLYNTLSRFYLITSNYTVFLIK